MCMSVAELKEYEEVNARGMKELDRVNCMCGGKKYINRCFMHIIVFLSFSFVPVLLLDDICFRYSGEIQRQESSENGIGRKRLFPRASSGATETNTGNE